MHIASSLTHPHVVPNLYEFLSAVEHKIRYFEECLGYNQLAIDFYSIYLFIYFQIFIQPYWKQNKTIETITEILLVSTTQTI